jgi:hypothetical protein
VNHLAIRAKVLDVADQLWIIKVGDGQNKANVFYYRSLRAWMPHFP